ncbi:MAG: heme-binding beta-barrel domain-containing protein [Bacteroidota bacterium]
MKKLILLAVFLPALLFAQTSKKDSLWLPLQSFIGNWAGEGGGEPGIGAYERSYQFFFDKNFIAIKNKSTYSPTDKNPKGEVHEDIGYFSYDKNLKKFKLRQFHLEGFVTEFTLENISPDGKTLVFTTGTIENIPAGWRAKETYQLLNENEMEETFELAEPQKEFELYTKVKLVRQE